MTVPIMERLCAGLCPKVLPPGTGNDCFSPDADCTRAQIVTFLYRDAQ